MIRVTQILVSVLLLISLACSHSPRPTGELGGITGTVIDADDDQPIRWATVHILGMQVGTLTDENGHFELKDIPPGKYSVEAAIIGWEREAKDGVIVSGNQIVNLEFRLYKIAPLRSRPRAPDE